MVDFLRLLEIFLAGVELELFQRHVQVQRNQLQDDPDSRA
jgi:hypothetical protein